MTLTPAQKEAVSAWIAAGDNLSAVQKKLIEQFQITLTYRDVRFLVDDLDLALKDAAPKVDTTDLSKATPPRAGAADESSPRSASEEVGDSAGEIEELGDAGAEELDAPPAGDSLVTVDVDKITLLPGALASGTVKFSDGVTGKWVVDQYGRPGFTEISQPGYRPSPADGQAFVRELSAQLQRRGF